MYVFLASAACLHGGGSILRSVVVVVVETVWASRSPAAKLVGTQSNAPLYSCGLFLTWCECVCVCKREWEYVVSKLFFFLIFFPMCVLAPESVYEPLQYLNMLDANSSSLVDQRFRSWGWPGSSGIGSSPSSSSPPTHTHLLIPTSHFTLIYTSGGQPRSR